MYSDCKLIFYTQLLPNSLICFSGSFLFSFSQYFGIILKPLAQRNRYTQRITVFIVAIPFPFVWSAVLFSLFFCAVPHYSITWSLQSHQVDIIYVSKKKFWKFSYGYGMPSICKAFKIHIGAQRGKKSFRVRSIMLHYKNVNEITKENKHNIHRGKSESQRVAA